MPEEKTCFIIMPISVPEEAVDTYRDGTAHFTNVLDCLFVPGVEGAGFTAIPPQAEGAEVIQADIIRNLETADLVLCDMSSLNPNVFFEFGIRTSLNKPVCVVKDDLTQRVPFDTGIINHHEYRSSLVSARKFFDGLVFTLIDGIAGCWCVGVRAKRCSQAVSGRRWLLDCVF